MAEKKSIQSALDRNHRVLFFSGWIDKIEGKGKKEKRFLIVSRDRIFSFRPGGKLARECHTLDIQELKAPSSTEFEIITKQWKLEGVSENCPQIVKAIRTAFKTIFQNRKEEEMLKLQVKNLEEISVGLEPMGGFSTCYQSLCNYQGAEPRADIVEQLEEIFAPGNITELDLREFEQPLSFSDFKALLGSTQYNNYFKIFTLKDFVLDKNMISCISDMIKCNNTLEELNLVKCGINKDTMTLLSESLTSNKFIPLTSINVSHNSIEDKGAQSLSNWISSLNRGLVKLNISHCSIAKMGMVNICNSLKKNVHMSSTLTYFEISHNKLESEGSSSLSTFLASPNAVKSVILINVSANLDIVLSAITRGCNELQILDTSFNKITKKEVTTLGRYLQASAHLKSLNLSSTTFPVDSLKDLFTALGSNYYIQSCKINLADNKLGTPGARALASVTEKMNNIHSLNLSDNELGDDGIGIIAESIQHSPSLKELILDRNYKGKTKTGQAVENLIKLFNTETSIESLSLAGSPKTEFKNDIIPFLSSLGKNKSLKNINLSGNQFGNKGAAALGRAIQTNNCLTRLEWDINGTSPPGFLAFYNGLKRNFSLKEMGLPITDLSNMMKEAPNTAAVLELISKIESVITRNQSPKSKFLQNGTDSTPNNLFAFLASGQREELEKLQLKIKGTGRKVSDEQKIPLEDAANQDQVITALFDTKDQVVAVFELELKKKMEIFVSDVYPVYGEVKSKLIHQILDLVKKNYGCFNDDDFRRRLQTSLTFGATGKDLTEEEFVKILVEAASGDLISKASEAFYSTATIASDYLYEKLYDLLKDIYDELNAEILEEEKKKEEARIQATVKSQPQPAKKAPSKAPPPVPSAKNKPTTAAKSNVPEVKLESLPKTESNLTHVTKERAAVQRNRKPPTRKPRAPVTESTETS